MDHPSYQLFERVRRFGSLPPEVADIPHQLDGPSFFPAGAGVFVEKPFAGLPRFPIGGIMALGHDWGTTRDFECCAPRHADRLRSSDLREMRGNALGGDAGSARIPGGLPPGAQSDAGA